MYLIRALCHRTDISMGHHGFAVELAPRFKELVKASGITQEGIHNLLTNSGRRWLDCAGFDQMFDPDNCTFRFGGPAPPLGPNARPSYEPNRDLRVSWGEWGPEHITVPGNACGLDLDRHSFGCIFDGGMMLQPHNIDSLSQKYLLLITFTEIAETVIMLGLSAERKEKDHDQSNTAQTTGDTG